MFFEAMDLYRTLHFNYNPMNYPHYENNFKRTKNCPVNRLIWMSLVRRGLTGVIIALWCTIFNSGEVVLRPSYLLLR